MALSNSLSETAKQATILPTLKSSSLISLGKLCDDGCKVMLDDKKLIAVKQKKIVMQGKRNSRDGLWDIPVDPYPIYTMRKEYYEQPSTHAAMYQPLRKQKVSCNDDVKVSKTERFSSDRQQYLHEFDAMNNLIDDNRDYGYINQQEKQDRINVILRKNSTKRELAQYLHKACFSPAISTFLTAIKNNHFTTWPGLTEDLIKNHLPVSEATVKGHMKEERHGLQSTQPRKQSTVPSKEPAPNPKPPDPEWTLMNDMNPVKQENETKTNQVAFSLHHNKNNRHKGFMDLTGRFPFKSAREMEYLLIAYVYDANAILVEPLKNKQAKTITDAWERIHVKCRKAGMEANTWVLDNETSATLETAFTKYKVKW